MQTAFASTSQTKMPRCELGQFVEVLRDRSELVSVGFGYDDEPASVTGHGTRETARQVVVVGAPPVLVLDDEVTAVSAVGDDVDSSAISAGYLKLAIGGERETPIASPSMSSCSASSGVVNGGWVGR